MYENLGCYDCMSLSNLVSVCVVLFVKSDYIS